MITIPHYILNNIFNILIRKRVYAQRANPMNTVTIKAFRTQFGLSDNFGVAHFAPKDFSGLAKIDESGTSLNQLREALLDAIPPSISINQLMPFLDALREQFRTGLIGINASIGLTMSQLEFAVAGFGDVCQAWGYALIHAKMSKQTTPLFHAVYRTWVTDSERVAHDDATYDHNGTTWHIRFIHNVYGRVGLQVITPNATYRVVDGQYACPAEGYMANLLADIAEKLKNGLI
jgi:hypothetical protein